jgi:hypothetical protein
VRNEDDKMFLNNLKNNELEFYTNIWDLTESKGVEYEKHR